MEGLYNKYKLERTDGKEIPLEDKFIILRYNRNEQWDSLCRRTLIRMCHEIMERKDLYPDLQQFATDLDDSIMRINLERAKTVKSEN